MSDSFSLIVSEKKKETANSISLVLEIPDDLKEIFTYKAGQYITFLFDSDGTEIRRSYSLCSAANGKEWRVGIKKVEGGVFSNWANDQLQVGAKIKVMPPQGHFFLTVNPEHANHYFAIAAGSGITPVLSMIRTVLETESKSTFTLAYGNQSMDETMFYHELEALRNQFPERLFIDYFFSRQSLENCFFGRIDRSMLNFLLKNKYRNVSFHSYYLCGPEEMIKEAKSTLQDKGVAEKDIHFELFTSKIEGELKEAHEGETEITITVDDITETFIMSQEKSVLEAALDQGMDAPYSCQGGICSSCLARVKEGKVEMKKNQILTDSELAEGLILTCQSHPTTPKLVVDYDDV
jgi:ring-1,2-phenylacetyl-CoA epoxidase subunit PaaE